MLYPDYTTGSRTDDSERAGLYQFVHHRVVFDATDYRRASENRTRDSIRNRNSDRHYR